MLRIIQNTSAAGAKTYYISAYYSEGSRMDGLWQGKGAKLLGLSGAIDKSDWESLCDNLDPRTGKRLTQRTDTHRRVGWDFNWHAPKSVSVVHALTGDERIVDVFRDAVRLTMEDMETEVQTRVSQGKRKSLRTIGNLVWGEWVHEESRPVDGIACPHLHAHLFTVNAGYDEKEQAWKALDISGVKKDAPYFQSLFHARLAQGIRTLGYEVERTRTGWEIAGVPASVRDKFSLRTKEIEEQAKALGITDPQAKDKLGALTRKRKSEHLSRDELQALWKERLTPDEWQALNSCKQDSSSGEVNQTTARLAVEHAMQHVFERASVVPERKILAVALQHGVGHVDLPGIQGEANRQGMIVRSMNGRNMATTQEVLSEEERIINYARQGRGSASPLAPERRIERDWLNEDQKRAAQHVWTSKDAIVVLIGAAGTGKTTLMTETVAGIEEAGHHVFTFAPSAQASRGVLQSEGFKAETVAKLLADQDLQESIRGQVVWIDEAGLLSSRQMAQVIDLINDKQARLILSGDDKQNSSVERGAVLRLLEHEAGIFPAQVKEIKRQQGEYREAVKALSEGDVARGYGKLAELGWIVEGSRDELWERLAKDYADTIQSGKTALIVSPTHFEAQMISDAVRHELKQRGKISKEEHLLPILKNLNLTQAERADKVNLQPGNVIFFHRGCKGIKPGTRFEAASIDSKLLEQSARFQVYRQDTLAFAPGDLIRFTANGWTLDRKHRLNNGTVYKLKSFSKDGNLILENGWKVSKDFSHLDRGLVVTSQASQGRTVDHVFIGETSLSAPAASREGFYVAASRGRNRATIFTDDRHALLEAVSQTDPRLSATELLQLPLQQKSNKRKTPLVKRMLAAARNLTERKGQRMEPTSLEVRYER